MDDPLLALNIHFAWYLSFLFSFVLLGNPPLELFRNRCLTSGKIRSKCWGRIAAKLCWNLLLNRFEMIPRKRCSWTRSETALKLPWSRTRTTVPNEIRSESAPSNTSINPDQMHLTKQLLWKCSGTALKLLRGADIAPKLPLNWVYPQGALTTVDSTSIGKPIEHRPDDVMTPVWRHRPNQHLRSVATQTISCFRQFTFSTDQTDVKKYAVHNSEREFRVHSSQNLTFISLDNEDVCGRLLVRILWRFPEDSPSFSEILQDSRRFIVILSEEVGVVCSLAELLHVGCAFLLVSHAKEQQFPFYFLLWFLFMKAQTHNNNKNKKCFALGSTDYRMTNHDSIMPFFETYLFKFVVEIANKSGFLTNSRSRWHRCDVTRLPTDASHHSSFIHYWNNRTTLIDHH